MSEYPTAPPRVPIPIPADTSASPPQGVAPKPGAIARVWSLRALIAAAITAVALSGAAGAGLAAAGNSAGGDGFGGPGGGPGGRFGPPQGLNGQARGSTTPGSVPPLTGPAGSGTGT